MDEFRPTTTEPPHHRQRASAAVLAQPAHAGYFGAAGNSLDDLPLTGPAGLASGDGIGLFDWLDDLLDLTHHH